MKIFVGGLPWAVDNARLKEVFSEFGPVVDAIVVYEKETDRSRGFGFVTFSDPEDAERLIDQGTLQVDGRQVRIDHANERRQSRGGGGRDHARGGGRGGGRDHGGYDEPKFEERRSRRGRGRERY